jgi:Xaa-Pro aminopeptidase
MVLCVEPTLVGPDGDPEWRQGIFVAEDQIAITETGVEVLTADLPRSLYRHAP